MARAPKFYLKGLDDYLEKIAAAGRSIDAAAADAAVAGAEVLLEGMDRRVPKGETLDLQGALAVGEVERYGNRIIIRVGVLNGDSDVERYGRAQEFGTSSMKAHSYIRVTARADKRKVNEAILASLKRSGHL